MNEAFECEVTSGPDLEELFEQVENKDLTFEQYPHFKIKTADGIELDLIETKHYIQLLKEYQKLKQDYKDLEKETTDFCDCWIHIDKIINLKVQREFELQQEYKEFKDDIEWQIYNKILEGRRK